MTVAGQVNVIVRLCDWLFSILERFRTTFAITTEMATSRRREARKGARSRGSLHGASPGRAARPSRRGSHTADNELWLGCAGRETAGSERRARRVRHVRPSRRGSRAADHELRLGSGATGGELRRIWPLSALLGARGLAGDGARVASSSLSAGPAATSRPRSMPKWGACGPRQRTRCDDVRVVRVAMTIAGQVIVIVRVCDLIFQFLSRSVQRLRSPLRSRHRCAAAKRSRTRGSPQRASPGGLPVVERCRSLPLLAVLDRLFSCPGAQCLTGVPHPFAPHNSMKKFSVSLASEPDRR